MFNRKNSQNSENTNFWISYADLMAGLLFVFILLIGAIMVKSAILKNSLHEKESVVSEQSETLNEQNQTLIIKEDEITKLKNLLAQREESLQVTKENLLISNNTLNLKAKELEKLNQLLLAQNTKIDDYSNHIVMLQNLTEEQNSSIREKEVDLESYKNRIVLLSNSMTQQEDKLKMSEQKLLDLLKAVDEKQTKYDELLTKLQAQKAQIKSLTGIKLKVIAELKSSLGDKINIDKSSGSLRLASNILFDKGSAKLKNGAKSELKATFIDYVNTLIGNKNIAKHLDKIIIEGHTDSDGSYLYNLNLSQQRAFAVMNYLLTLEYIKEHNIKDKLVASGRSYLDAIKVNGMEDKDASRRIEVKFRLKNEDAMYEIERILDAD
jgi:chemotaxis protein MotB